MIEVSEVFFLLFLQGIQKISGVTLDKLSLCLDKIETIKLSLQISISEGFYSPLLLLNKSVLGIDLDLFTVFYVSVLWVELDLSNDLTFSGFIDYGCVYCFIGCL